MAIGTLLFTTIDCRDPMRVAGFWAQVLDTEVDVSMDDGRFVFLKAVKGGLLCFQRVAEPKTGKNRIHLDLSVEDLDTATAMILELGGARVGEDRQLEQFTWRTMADPEGNEFDIAIG